MGGWGLGGGNHSEEEEEEEELSGINKISEPLEGGPTSLWERTKSKRSLVGGWGLGGGNHSEEKEEVFGINKTSEPLESGPKSPCESTKICRNLQKSAEILRFFFWPKGPKNIENHEN